ETHERASVVSQRRFVALRRGSDSNGRHLPSMERWWRQDSGAGRAGKGGLDSATVNCIMPAMSLEEDDLTLAKLADQTGVSERPIRYYIQFGLLPAPEGAGPKSRYGRSHLGRLRLIRMLQDRHLPLSAIRKILAQRSEREIARMAENPGKKAPSSALDYVR